MRLRIPPPPTHTQPVRTYAPRRGVCARFRGWLNAAQRDSFAAIPLPREKRLGGYLSFQNIASLFFLRRAAVSCHVGRGNFDWNKVSILFVGFIP